MLGQEELQHRFSFHPADTDAKRDMHEAVRNLCLRLVVNLDGLLPDSREKSLAITNLEQVMFWANAAIARNTH